MQFSLRSAFRSASVKDLKSSLCSFDTTQDHGAKGRSHTVGSIIFRQLHASNDDSGRDLTSAFNNGIFRAIHVESTHATQFLNGIHAHETLGTECTKWPIMTSSGDDKRCVDGTGKC